jgi:hypothetical protein
METLGQKMEDAVDNDDTLAQEAIKKEFWQCKSQRDLENTQALSKQQTKLAKPVLTKFKAAELKQKVI